MTAYVLDTETHDVNEPHATEIAHVKVVFKDEQLVLLPQTAFEQRYNPLMPISLGSSAITLIFDEDIADCPPHTDFALPEDCQYLIGHNIDFDCTVVKNTQCAIDHVKTICTLALARKFYPDLPNHQLGTMLCYFDKAIAKKHLKQAHGARYDIWFTFIVLQHICHEQNITNFEQLFEIATEARIPTVMSFGKHKGEAIANLPSNYADWLLNQDNIDLYLKLAIRRTQA